MKKRYIIAIVLVCLFVLAVLTNPNIEQHQFEIKKQVQIFIQQKNEQGRKIKMGKFKLDLNSAFGESLIDLMIQKSILSNSYSLFSTTQFSWDGQSYTVAIGVFGFIFFLGKDKLQEIIQSM